MLIAGSAPSVRHGSSMCKHILRKTMIAFGMELLSNALLVDATVDAGRSALSGKAISGFVIAQGV